MLISISFKRSWYLYTKTRLIIKLNLGYGNNLTDKDNPQPSFLMGIIYKITSPRGKIYIGQTIHTLEYRWNQHIYESKREKKTRTFLFGKAIRKYKPESFKKEILVECDESELNYYETKFVTLYESNNTDKGYNLTSGGDKGFQINAETKKKISNSLRQTHGNDLPEYLIKCGCKSSGYVGYSIINHPKCNRKRFCGTIDNQEKTLQRAIKYLDKLNNTDFTEEKQNLPKYISFVKSRNGYAIGYPISGRSKLRATFTSQRFTLEQNKQSAIKQLEKWKIKYPQKEKGSTTK